MNKYKMVIFDMDGTILDTLEDLKNCINYALEICGYPTRTTNEVRMFVGNGLQKLVERAVPEGTTQEEKEDVFEKLKSYYKEHCTDNTKAYEGILDLLLSLRRDGYMTAVVSNKADFAVQELVRDYFDGLFDYAVGEREDVRKKPAPDAVNAILSKCGLNPDEAIYIGDSDVDIETAKNAHMDCISVLWGFRDHTFLEQHGASVYAEKPEDILSLLAEKK